MKISNILSGVLLPVVLVALIAAGSSPAHKMLFPLSLHSPSISLFHLSFFCDGAALRADCCTGLY
jgi:hypothetical protein